MNEKIEPNQETAGVSSATENSIWLSDALNREPEPAGLNASPKQKITLIRAFKERSRIIRQIDLISRQIRDENSIIEGGLRSIDVRQSYAEYTRLYCKLITLKKAISSANNGIIEKLVELAEIKSFCRQLKLISAQDGKQETRGYDESEVRVMTAEIKKAEIAAEMEALQTRMDALQDEIDEFNARTLIEFEP